MLVGAIAAGEKVVADAAAAVAEFLSVTYGDALAVEMEGRGFLAAAHANAPTAAVVGRGISDLLSGKAQADAHGGQTIAAHHASAFAFQIISRFEPGLGPNASRQHDERRSKKMMRDGILIVSGVVALLSLLIFVGRWVQPGRRSAPLLLAEATSQTRVQQDTIARDAEPRDKGTRQQQSGDMDAPPQLHDRNPDKTRDKTHD